MSLQPIPATWTAPTTNTDGSAIAAGEITGYQINISATSGGATVASLSVGPTVLSADLSTATPALSPGNYFADIRVTGPVDSAFTGEVAFTAVAVPLVPNPPSGFSVA